MAVLKQRTVNNFCVASKKSRKEMFEMLKTDFWKNVMKKTALYKWYSNFSARR